MNRKMKGRLPKGINYFLLSGISASVFAFSTTVAVANTEWTLASKFPSTSIQGEYYQVVADRLAELSDGEFTIQIFPSETIGATQAVLDQLQVGAVTLYPEGIGFLERFHEPFAVFELPFIFESADHWVEFFHSDMVGEWRDELAPLDIDVVHLQTLDPYRVMLSSEPVETLNDLQGMSLRMFPNEKVIGVWEHLGANVQVLEWTDVYEALRTGMVAGVTGGVAGVYDMSFHEPAPYILRTDEYPQGVAWMVHRSSYDALSDDEREMFYDALASGAEWVEANYAQATEERIRNQIANHGVRYLRVDMGEWRDSAAEYYTQLEEQGELPAGTIEYIEALR